MTLLLVCLCGCTALPGPAAEIFAVPGTGIRMEMVRVPGGRFARGEDGEVRVRPFWISTREVTWADFDYFFEFPGQEEEDGVTRPSSGKSYLMLSGLPPDFMEPGRPVTNLRFHSALAYCEWLSRRTGMIFRLPTEAEWEVACRAGGEGEGWHRGNSGGRTHAAGEGRPDALGLRDMLGNAWEYCLEPQRPPDFEPVLRGGAWNSPPSDLKASSRKTALPEWSEADPNRPFSVWWFRDGYSQGFRVVRVPEASGPEERAACARKIEISGLAGRERVAKVAGSAMHFSRVTGTVRNGGDRPLEELALKVFYLDPQGRPHLEDTTSTQTRRATFNVCFPVLANSAHPGPHAAPLRPGESRAFAVDLPLSFDSEDRVDATRFGASVLYVIK